MELTIMSRYFKIQIDLSKIDIQKHYTEKNEAYAVIKQIYLNREMKGLCVYAIG